MNKKRKISLLILLSMIISIFAVGCGAEKAEETSFGSIEANIATLKGPTSMGMINMIDKQMLNNDMTKVNYEIIETPTLMMGKVLNNEVQIAAVPTNLAAILYNKTEGEYQFLAENTLSVLHIVGREDITSLEDLVGKKVITSGKNTVVEYAINYILKSNNLMDKIEVEYLPDHASTAQTILAGDADYAILPQPFVTQVVMTDKNIKRYIDLNDEWTKIDNNNSVLCMGCLIVNKEFYDNNTAFVEAFLKLYKQSVDFTNNNPEEASIMIEKAGILPKAKLAELAIPDSNIVFKNAADSKAEITEFLTILFESNPASIGGKMPDEGFFAD